MQVWKMISLFKQVIFRFHVNFPGCILHGPMMIFPYKKNGDLYISSMCDVCIFVWHFLVHHLGWMVGICFDISTTGLKIGWRLQTMNHDVLYTMVILTTMSPPEI